MQHRLVALEFVGHITYLLVEAERLFSSSAGSWCKQAPLALECLVVQKQGGVEIQVECLMRHHDKLQLVMLVVETAIQIVLTAKVHQKLPI